MATQGPDVIHGTPGKDIINALGGDDTIYLSAGADRIDGGAGFDTLSGVVLGTTGVTISLVAGSGHGGYAAGDTYTGIERVFGTQYDDTLIGNDAANFLGGYHGADEIKGLGGNDILYGAAGGVFGADDGMADTLYGGGGNDELYGGDGNDRLFGGPNNDILKGDRGSDRMNGGGGMDAADYSAYPLVIGGTRLVADLAKGRARIDGSKDTLEDIENVFGTAFADKITGDKGANGLLGFSGDDKVFGGGGNDSISGDAGNDRLYGGSGVDSLFGHADDDILEGGAKGDRMFGHAGIDAASYAKSQKGVHANLVLGGQSGDARGDQYSGIEDLIGSEKDDRLVGDDGGNLISGRGGDDRLEGAHGVDTLYGGSGNDKLEGGDLFDILFGGSDRDKLYGGHSNDRLDGGAGDDQLWGGHGRDTFVHKKGYGQDTIRDMRLGPDGDYIDLRSYGFKNVAQVQALASDIGGGIAIDLGRKDTLIVEDITAGDLTGAVLLI